MPGLRTQGVISWLLCDYGQVLSTAPPPDEWDRLRRAAGDLPEADFHAAYWRHRPAYDRGDLTARQYWNRVAGERAPVDSLVPLDCGIWTHPDPDALDAAIAAACQHGWGLAVLSNAPIEVAEAIDGLDWLKPFHPRFFSCHLRAVKPEPAAYTSALEGLRVGAQEVLFSDDRPDNVTAAQALGMRAVVFESPATFEAL